MGPHWGKSSITFSVNLLDPTLACIVPHPPYRLRNQKKEKESNSPGDSLSIISLEGEKRDGFLFACCSQVLLCLPPDAQPPLGSPPPSQYLATGSGD